MANTPSWPVFRTGYSSYYNIVALQALLNFKSNAGLTLTGIYDTATVNAVTAYQSSHSLDVDGVAGAATLGSLTSNCLVQNGTVNSAAFAAQFLLSKFESISATGSFDSSSDTTARTFQQKMGIGVDGKIGPTSWRYLFGYYFYPLKGCDTATALTNAQIQTLVNNGYTFVGKYLPGSAFPMTVAEKDRILSANLSIVSIFEYNPTSASYFTSAQGAVDAQTAINGATAMGQPSGTPIYFTVDYDATNSEISGCISTYLNAVYQKFNALGNPYKIGLYGSGALLEYFKSYTDYLWLACATAWRGSTAFSHYCMKQYVPFYIGSGAGSVEIDRDDGNTNMGAWN